MKVGTIFRILRHPSGIPDVVLRHLLKCTGFLLLYHTILLPLVVSHVKQKKTINVIFLAMSIDMWRYDELYRKLRDDPRFNPMIVTAMRENEPVNERIKMQDKLLRYFVAKGYRVIPGYDAEKEAWINLNKYNPNLIFYTQPYDGIIEDAFEFRHRLFALHCYAPYSFQMSKIWWNWNNDLQNFCWRHFLPGPYQLEVCSQYSRIKGRNAEVVGYCLEEELALAEDEKKLADIAWNHDCRKRVIWAPHHSIYASEMFKVSSFLEIADLMLSLRNEYADKIVFGFKPHPVLKSKLETIWGEDKTARYYESWAKSNASFDASGDYRYLFAGSDAMIHCSGSFALEYLYTRKPVQYVYSKVRNPPDMGELGDAALAAHYSARSEDDIRRFLDTVVLGGEDRLWAARDKVVRKYLQSATGMYFSENIYRCIKGVFQ